MNQKLFCFFFFLSGLSLAQYTATSSHFIPIPLSEELPSRVSVNFSFEPTPSFEFETAYIYQLGSGFDVGTGLHGGVREIENYGILGLDLMFRFLKPVSEVVFLGVGAQVGYVYTGIGDVSVALNYASAIPITTGLIIGGVVRDLTRFYFSPAVEFGQTMNIGDPLWKSGIGLRFTMGAAVSLSDTTYLVIETRPRIKNLTGPSGALNTFTVDATLALLFDF